jgi:hypothetical protein
VRDAGGKQVSGSAPKWGGESGSQGLLHLEMEMVSPVIARKRAKTREELAYFQIEWSFHCNADLGFAPNITILSFADAGY